MLRSLISTGVTLVLSLVILAACADDTDDTGEHLDDPPLGAADDSDTDPADDDAAAPPDELIVEEDGSTEVDSTATPTTEDTGGALPAEEEKELADDMHEHASDTEPAEEATESDPLAIVLSDFEIEMAQTVQSGTVVIEVTNESEREHGVVIEQIDPDDDGNPNVNGENGTDEYLVSMTLEAGATEQQEIELPPGQYVIFCPVDDHRELGMETQLTVE